LRMTAKGFQQVRCLADRPFSFLKHVKKKSQLAQ
jgi:hypothetical protein